MNEQEAHDLLIRIDANQTEVTRRVIRIEENLEKRPCYTHAEKIKTLEKIVWGSVMLSMGAVVKSFWASIGGH